MISHLATRSFAQASPGKNAYLILDGVAEVSVLEAGVARKLANAGPGVFLGELAMISGRNYSVTATARNTLTAAAIERDTFLRLAGEFPEFGLRVQRSLAKKLEAMVAEFIECQTSLRQCARLCALKLRSVESCNHRHMVGRLRPAARFAQDFDAATARRDVGRRPDMVKPAAAVGRSPIAGAIAPPGIELLVGGNMFAHDVDPVAGALDAAQAFSLDRRVADHLEQLAVRPNVVFERRDIEIADDDAIAAARHRAIGEPVFEFVDELQLVGEFLVDRGVGFIAAGRHIEIVNDDRCRAAETAEIWRQSSLPQKCRTGYVLERQPRHDGDAVIAGLPALGDVGIAELLQGRGGKLALRAFGLLKAEDVRLPRLEKAARRDRCASAPN